MDTASPAVALFLEGIKLPRPNRYDVLVVSISDYATLSLTTDYGLGDGFVAACHGVAATQAPGIRVIDVSHAVPPGDIRHGAVLMAQTLPYLPTGVHVGVVDPGVGTTRRPIVIATDNGLLVGPDNGLLLWAAEALGGPRRIMSLTNSRLHRHPTSRTFHGRDVFVPVAAALSGGWDLDDVGDPVALKDLIHLRQPHVAADEDGITSDVHSVDQFGNIQLAARAEILEDYGETFRVVDRAARRADMFAAAPRGGLVVLADSAGHIAVAVNGGSAARLLNIGVRDTLRLTAT